MGPGFIGELEIHVVLYVRQVGQSTNKNNDTYKCLQCLFYLMSNTSNKLKKIYIHSNYTYVEHVKTLLL